jgi:lysophospholipase L1-like esterase
MDGSQTNKEDLPMRSRHFSNFLVLLFALAMTAPAVADLPWQFDNNTRYMALGDSLVAGYGAVPATQGYVYLLYKDGAFDRMTNTLLSNAGVPGVTSRQVLEHQVPQAIEAFRPTVITLTVGGNDLLRILKGADTGQVLSEFQTNLTLILQNLRTALPNTRIIVSNLYTVPQIPGADQIVPIFNQIVTSVASAFNVPVADVYSAFLGRHGLLLIERPGAAADEVHPTNAGYHVMAKAFEAVIR